MPHEKNLHLAFIFIFRICINIAGCQRKYTSPSIDTGDNAAPQLPATDLDGNPLIFNGDYNGSSIVDMRVYEYREQMLCSLYSRRLQQRRFENQHDNRDISTDKMPRWTHRRGISFYTSRSLII
jgi:hypothetical protein